jgi:hypothetical protein
MRPTAGRELVRAVAEAVDDVLWVERGAAGMTSRRLTPAERDELVQTDLSVLAEYVRHYSGHSRTVPASFAHLGRPALRQAATLSGSSDSGLPEA